MQWLLQVGRGWAFCGEGWSITADKAMACRFASQQDAETVGRMCFLDYYTLAVEFADGDGCEEGKSE